MGRNVYQTITDQIVAALEKGVRPWLQPWSAGHMEGRVVLPLRHNSVPYRGVNIVALWMQVVARGYAAPIWMTFQQAIDLGGCVRKGEKGSLTVYADKITRAEIDAQTGEESPHDIHYMKGCTVFNVEQIEGLPERYCSRPAPRLEPVQRIERAERFFAATGADIVHGGTRACYVQSSDSIHMPCIELFRDAESYTVREVPIPPWLMKALNLHFDIAAAQRNQARAHQRIWPFHRVTIWRSVKRAMMLAQIIGPAACPRGLRHSFGVGTLQAAVPLNLLQRWLGHARISTTAIYADASGAEEQAFAAQFWRANDNAASVIPQLWRRDAARG